MRILLDHMEPHDLRHAFEGHDVVTAAYRDWADLTNGRLLDAAQKEFDVLVTLDQSLETQQAIAHYDLAVVVLAIHPATEENLRNLVPKCLISLHHVQPGRVYRVEL